MCRPRPRAHPWFFVRKQFHSLLFCVPALLKLPVPDLVGVLNVDFQMRIQMRSDRLCHFTHEFIVRPMRHTEPGICVQVIRQFAEKLQRNAFFRKRRIADHRSVGPFFEFRAVCVLKIHESDGVDAFPACDERRIPHSAGPFRFVFKAGTEDLKIAQIVGRIGLADLEPERTVFRIDLNADLPQTLFEDPGVHERDLPFSAIPYRVRPARKMGAFDRAQRCLGKAVRLQTAHPAAFVQLQFRTFAPTFPFTLTDPPARLKKNVDERQLGVPVRRPSEIDPHRRPSRSLNGLRNMRPAGLFRF